MTDNIDDVVVEEVLEEAPVYEVDPESCKHDAGVNYCSGVRENGDACSHCSLCGTQLQSVIGLCVIKILSLL